MSNSDLDLVPAKIKIVLLGNSYTGKTSIIDSYVQNRYNQFYKPTLSIDFFVKTIIHHHKKYRLQLWDSAGQQRFKSLATNYVRNADVALIIFDVSQIMPDHKKDKDVEENLGEVIQHWVQLFNEANLEKGFMVLVGNKIDIKERSISRHVGLEKARKMGIEYREVSAKTGQNLEELFKFVIEQYQANQLKRTSKQLSYMGSSSVQRILKEQSFPQKSHSVYPNFKLVSHERHIQSGHQDLQQNLLLKPSQQTGEATPPGRCRC